jgi:magnesium-transporting ATPase (P-type)
MVVLGQGRGVVVATREKTEYGNIVRQSNRSEPNEAFPAIKGKHFVLPFFLLPALVMRVQQGADPITMLVIYGGSALLLLLLQDMDWCKFALMQWQRGKLFSKTLCCATAVPWKT